MHCELVTSLPCQVWHPVPDDTRHYPRVSFFTIVWNDAGTQMHWKILSLESGDLGSRVWVVRN